MGWDAAWMAPRVAVGGQWLQHVVPGTQCRCSMRSALHRITYRLSYGWRCAGRAGLEACWAREFRPPERLSRGINTIIRLPIGPFVAERGLAAAFFCSSGLPSAMGFLSCHVKPRRQYVVRKPSTYFFLVVAASFASALERLHGHPWVTLGRPPCRLTRPLALPAGPLRVLSVSASSVGDPEIFESALTPTGMHGRSECRHQWEDTGYTYVVRTMEKALLICI